MLKMASNFSKDVVNGLSLAAPPRQKQVMLKVRFAEADRQKLTQWGFNLFSTGATNTIGTIGTQQFGPLATQGITSGSGGTSTNFTLSDLLNIFIFRPDINLGATIKALQQKNVLQILAEPNLMALSGETAHFLAARYALRWLLKSVPLTTATRLSFPDSPCRPFKLDEQKPRLSSKMAKALALPAC
jgi:pilus assembly protein CpaC